jgi:hypothetical protein
MNIAALVSGAHLTVAQYPAMVGTWRWTYSYNVMRMIAKMTEKKTCVFDTGDLPFILEAGDGFAPSTFRL